MSRVYATEDDYKTWTGDDTATATTAQLRNASLVVDELLATAVYDVDEDDLPTDDAVIEALRDATCAQLEWWNETGDTSGVGASGQFQSASIGSASYTRGDTTSTTNPGGGIYAPATLRVLSTACLLGGSVYD